MPTGVYRSGRIRRAIDIAIIVCAATWAFIALSGTVSDVSGYASASVGTAAGVIIFGLGLGFRMRLKLEVLDEKGNRNSTAAAYILQRIQTMGSRKPRGFTDPQGMDILTLPEQAVNTLPEPQGKIVAALLRALRTTASINPWSANVVIVDKGTATVELRRNGGQADSTLIFASSLGVNSDGAPGDSEAVPHDLLTAAAAFLLMQLGKSHVILTRGLHGATKWRSVACQVLAGTPPYDESDEVKERLFGAALEKDPKNEAARLGYVVCRAGNRVGGLQNELRFVNRLEEIQKRLEQERREDDLPLRLRVLWSLVIARSNLSVLYREANDDRNYQNQCSYAHFELDELDEAINYARGTAEEGVVAFASELRPKVDVLKKSLFVNNLNRVRPTTDVELGEITPRTVYNRACCNSLERSTITPQPDGLEDILDDLEFCFGLPELRLEARMDPYLRALREDDVGGPRLMALLDKPQLSDIEGLRPHAKQLKFFGIRSVNEFLERSAGEEAASLAESLDVPLTTIRWMRDVCLLIKKCPNPRHAVGWANTLIQEGVDTPAAMRDLLKDPASREHAQRQVRTVDAIPFDKTDLKKWARRFAFARMIAR
ncbi:hypothetical protein [Streptomyces nigra]|uniref:hypothetical protein n=1 Tax=Streptomyces nigra TaxID=1827580 RepID=UPI0035DB7B43